MYLVKNIKTYKKDFARERESKDLVFYGKCWENYDKIGLLLWVIGNISPFAVRKGNQNSLGKILRWRIVAATLMSRL